MAARNRARAKRRVAERTRRNALALATVAEVVDEPIRRKVARHRTRLEELHARGAISSGQKRAGDRLSRDYYASNTMIGRLTAAYAPRMKSRAKYQDVPETPFSISARERYDNAMQAAGRWLAPILVHVCITDQPPSHWGPLNGKAATDGLPLLRLGLDALAWHYSAHRRAA
jgi:hypothetical protein